MRNAVFLSADRTMFPAAIFTAHTVRQYARERPFDIFIAVPENSIEPDWIDWASAHAGVAVKEVPFAGHLDIGRSADATMPSSSCYRYRFELFIPSNYERLVYLDSDIRVAGDLSGLFDLDMGGQLFAGCLDGGIVVQDPNGETGKACWDPSIPYANCGVLAIDAPRWLAQDFGRRVLDNLRANLATYHFYDQTALNSLAKGEFQPISPVWNMLTYLWRTNQFSDLVEPAVIHHAGRPKPWDADCLDFEERRICREFFRSSPWPGVASITQQRHTLKTYRRYLRRWARWTLTGRATAYKYPDRYIERYRDHIHTFRFADVEQGLVERDAAGVLRAH